MTSKTVADPFYYLSWHSFLGIWQRTGTLWNIWFSFFRFGTMIRLVEFQEINLIHSLLFHISLAFQSLWVSCQFRKYIRRFRRLVVGGISIPTSSRSISSVELCGNDSHFEEWTFLLHSGCIRRVNHRIVDSKVFYRSIQSKICVHLGSSKKNLHGLEDSFPHHTRGGACHYYLLSYYHIQTQFSRWALRCRRRSILFIRIAHFNTDRKIATAISKPIKILFTTYSMPGFGKNFYALNIFANWFNSRHIFCQIFSNRYCKINTTKNVLLSQFLLSHIQVVRCSPDCWRCNRRAREQLL